MFRPKDTNGSWLEPFDQFAWGGDYTEAGVSRKTEDQGIAVDARQSPTCAPRLYLI